MSSGPRTFSARSGIRRMLSTTATGRYASRRPSRYAATSAAITIVV